MKIDRRLDPSLPINPSGPHGCVRRRFRTMRRCPVLSILPFQIAKASVVLSTPRLQTAMTLAVLSASGLRTASPRAVLSATGL